MNPPAGSRIVVGMSGGVDSSVAAALLKDQGYDVIGVMLRLWSDSDTENRCCAPDAQLEARRIAAQLDIPFYVIDAQEPFYQAVVQPFIDGYAGGTTPNPCLNCNRQIRWKFLRSRAKALGTEYISTGCQSKYRISRIVSEVSTLLPARSHRRGRKVSLSTHNCATDRSGYRAPTTKATCPWKRPRLETPTSIPRRMSLS